MGEGKVVKPPTKAVRPAPDVTVTLPVASVPLPKVSAFASRRVTPDGLAFTTTELKSFPARSSDTLVAAFSVVATEETIEVAGFWTTEAVVDSRESVGDVIEGTVSAPPDLIDTEPVPTIALVTATVPAVAVRVSAEFATTEFVGAALAV